MTRRRDDGSATVWVLGCVPLLVLMTVAVLLRAAAVTGRHAAESAADLAALAAAGRIGTSGSPCAAAGRWARANSARLTGCVLALSADGRSGTVRVVVVRPVRLPVLGDRLVRADARAARLPPGPAAPVALRLPGRPPGRCGMLATAKHRLVNPEPSSVKGWKLRGTLRVEAGRG